MIPSGWTKHIYKVGGIDQQQPHRINSDCGNYRIYQRLDKRYQLYDKRGIVGVSRETLGEVLEQCDELKGGEG